MASTSTISSIASEIHNQIGRRAFLMMGSRTILAGDNSLMFDIRGCEKINKIRVTLDPSDTYTVEFFKIRGTTCREVASVEGVYCDNLRDVIESRTGLYLSL